MKAYCLIRSGPHYRHEAFCDGLAAVGYKVICQPATAPAADDVLIIWNRYGGGEAQAQLFERAGAKVLVAENGYFGKDANGIQYYAIARSGHNGSGWWYVPSESDVRGARFDALGITFADWQRNDDGHILVCGQRGIGPPLMASPTDWHNDVALRLKRFTKRAIRVREHPGNTKPAPVPLDDDLAGAWAVVVWSSSVAVKATVDGLPVFFEAPHQVIEDCLHRGIRNIEQPFDYPRRHAFERMAWAQWAIDEIGTGTPFNYLLCGGQP